MFITQQQLWNIVKAFENYILALPNYQEDTIKYLIHKDLADKDYTAIHNRFKSIFSNCKVDGLYDSFLVSACCVWLHYFHSGKVPFLTIKFNNGSVSRIVTIKMQQFFKLLEIL